MSSVRPSSAGTQLAWLRLKAGLTCTEAARRAGITRKTLRAIERGHRTSPEIAQRLANVLGPRAYTLAVRRPPRNASPLLRLRLARSLSRQELARRTGLSYGVLRAAELGNATIAPNVAQTLADYYGEPVGDVAPRNAAA